MLPDSLVAPLRAHLDKVPALHQLDLAEGFGQVFLPDALAQKFKAAPQAWGWQWVFPLHPRALRLSPGRTQRASRPPQAIADNEPC